jgi:hypothetical protein
LPLLKNGRKLVCLSFMNVDPQSSNWPFILDIADNPNGDEMHDLNKSKEDTTSQGWST